MTATVTTATATTATTAVHVGRLLLELLAGRAPAPLPLPPREELVERASSGAAVDVDVIAFAHASTLAARVEAAIAGDAVAVVLADGSTLVREQAERQLAAKEERRVYAPLRLPLERAVARAARPLDERATFARAQPAAHGLLVRPAARAKLVAFLASTTTCADAARDFLTSAGHAPLDGDASLRRALDLPAPAWFAADGVTSAVRAALAATPGHARQVARTNAPRALCGHVVDDGATTRLLVAPTCTAARHLTLARGAGVVVARALGAAEHAPGLALALVDAHMRRALDHGRDDAERSFRITCATALLHARARAAAALAGADVVDDEHHRDELVEVARAGVRGALRGDAGAVFVDTLLGPPWPDGMALAPTVIAAVDDARAWAALARSWLSLREAFDEGCAVRPRALAGLSELPAVDVDDEGTFWRQLLDEAL